MDRFDDIWKNRFNDDGTSTNDWNTPDDDLVWGEIVKAIPRKKKRPKWFWLWWCLGILLIGLCTLIIFQKIRAKDQLVNRSTDTSESVVSPVRGEAHSKNSVQAPFQTNTDRSDTSPDIKSNSRPSSIQSIIKKKEESRENIKRPQVIPSGQLTNERKLLVVEDTLSTSQKKTKEIENIQIIGPIEAVPTLKPDLLVKTEILPPYIPLGFPETGTREGNVSIFGHIGLVYWQHRISEQYRTDLGPFDFNYSNDFGWQASVGVHIPINEYLTTFGGLQYDQVKSSSGHNSPLKYNVLNEQDASNSYTQNLATPYGAAKANFDLNRKADVSTDEIDLLVDFHSEHLIQNWSVPVGLIVHPLGKERKVNLFASIGFGINYLSGLSNTIDAIDTNHDAIQFGDSGPIEIDETKINKWHYDTRLGMGFTYPIFPSVDFQINYNWTRGLSSIFQQENYNTKIDRHQLSVGIIKSFKSSK